MTLTTSYTSYFLLIQGSYFYGSMNVIIFINVHHVKVENAIVFELGRHQVYYPEVPIAVFSISFTFLCKDYDAQWSKPTTTDWKDCYSAYEVSTICLLKMLLFTSNKI